MGCKQGITSADLYHILLEEVERENLVWPASSAWELFLGAILVQNTSWSNVLLALEEVERATRFDPHHLRGLEEEALQKLIYSAGFYRGKAAAIQGFLAWMEPYQFDFDQVRAAFPDAEALRKHLLTLRGIGPETADVLLLYVFHYPAFIADAYARRLYAGLESPHAATYERLKQFVERTTELSVADWQVFHLLILEYGKTYFRGRGPHQAPLLEKYRILPEKD